MSDPTMRLESDPLFVVACPVCHGHVAASGSLCGRDACCPLCASLFRVPFLEPEGTAPAPEPAGTAEDWDHVIRRLEPPRRVPTTAAPAPVEPPDHAFELPLEEATSMPPAAAPSDAARETTVATDGRDGSAEPVQPGPGPAPPAQRTDEFVFREPVPTVRHGGVVIEIRRLTPEERRSRRLRRTLLLILVGTSILVALVVLLIGPPKGR